MKGSFRPLVVHILVEHEVGMEPTDAVSDPASSRTHTLVDHPNACAASNADWDGFVFLNYRGDTWVKEPLCYAKLLVRAKTIAAALQATSKPGDRVLILCPSGLDYVVAFFGSLLAGMVAVPTYPPCNARHSAPIRRDPALTPIPEIAVVERSHPSGRTHDTG